MRGIRWGLLFAACVVALLAATWREPLGTFLRREAPRSASSPERDAAASPAHVDDASQVLGPFGIIVEKLCALLRSDLGIDVRVVTSRSGSGDIAALAEQQFRSRAVGDGAPTGGVLILLDGDNARIEVSYALEGVYPDAFVSRLARDQLVPYASHRAAGMAVADVVHFLRDRALDAIAAGELELPTALRQTDRLEELLIGRSGGAGAQVALPDLPSHAEFKRRISDADRGQYAPSEDPRESAAAFRRANRDLAGDPTLELYTAGSRIMRARYPVAPYEELLRADAMDRSEPLELQVDGDYAFFGSARPARTFVPILLVREDGLWRVDSVETYKNFFFDQNGMYVMVNRANPYARFVPGSKAGSDASLAPVKLYAEPLDEAIARLEGSELPGARFRLAEILMRNCWVTPEAIALYAEAAAGAPDEVQFVTTLADRASYLGMPEIAIEPLKRLGPTAFLRVGWAYERSGQSEQARDYYRRALDREPGSREAKSALDRVARNSSKTKG